MSRIPKEIVDQIIEAANILEVIGKHVPTLKRRGQNYWACCPFHDEKTPSFSVNPAKGLYKCFGCGKAGGVVQFLIDVEGASYPEALRALAQQFGVPVPGGEEAQAAELAQQQDREALAIVVGWANTYYREQLASEAGASVAGSLPAGARHHPEDGGDL